MKFDAVAFTLLIIMLILIPVVLFVIGIIIKLIITLPELAIIVITIWICCYINKNEIS